MAQGPRRQLAASGTAGTVPSQHLLPDHLIAFLSQGLCSGKDSAPIRHCRPFAPRLWGVQTSEETLSPWLAKPPAAQMGASCGSDPYAAFTAMAGQRTSMDSSSFLFPMTHSKAGSPARVAKGRVLLPLGHSLPPPAFKTFSAYLPEEAVSLPTQETCREHTLPPFACVKATLPAVVTKAFSKGVTAAQTGWSCYIPPPIHTHTPALEGQKVLERNGSVLHP